jgi:hypothetical protein
MRRKERLKFIAKIRAQVLAEVEAEKQREQAAWAALDRAHRERERKRKQEIYEENCRHFAIYDACAASVTSAVLLKYQQLRRSMGDKKRTHGLQNGNWKAP